MAHAQLHARGPFYPIEFTVGLKYELALSAPRRAGIHATLHHFFILYAEGRND